MVRGDLEFSHWASLAASSFAPPFRNKRPPCSGGRDRWRRRRRAHTAGGQGLCSRRPALRRECGRSVVLIFIGLHPKKLDGLPVFGGYAITITTPPAASSLIIPETET